jgi:hypothetical protein
MEQISTFAVPEHFRIVVERYGCAAGASGRDGTSKGNLV